MDDITLAEGETVTPRLSAAGGAEFGVPWYLAPQRPQVNLPHTIDRMRPLPPMRGK